MEQYAIVHGEEIEIRPGDVLYLRMKEEGLHDMSKGIFKGLDLRHCDLRMVDLAHAEFVGADLQGSQWSGGAIYGVYLRDADLRDAYMSRMVIKLTDFRGADLRGVDMSGTRVDEYSRFDDAMFDIGQAPRKQDDPDEYWEFVEEALRDMGARLIINPRSAREIITGTSPSEWED